MSVEVREELQKSYRQIIKELSTDDKKIIVDKLPLRFLQSGFIKDLFPNAKFLFMQRHPYDVILSNFFQNYAPTKAFIHFGSLDESANMYYKTINLWNVLKQNLGENLKEVRYEDLTTDAESTMKEVCEFLNIEFHESMLNKNARLQAKNRISTNSYAQVSEDIYQHSQNRWLNYNSSFDFVSEEFKLLAKQMGYEV
jgi:hypothetical protein